MSIEEILLGLYQVGMGYVNGFLIAQDEVTIVDCGLPKRRETFLNALSQAGRKPADLKHIALTHHHADHTGSLAAIIEATGASAYIHPLDAPIVRGEKAAPGPNRKVLAGRLLGPLMARITPKLEAVQSLQETNDGDELPAAGGMKAVHTPGHTAGHLSYLWPHNGGVLFAGDAAGNLLGRLGPPVNALGGMFTEDLASARDSFRKLAALEFDIACFGHGRVLKGKAHAAFRRAVEKMAK